MTAAALPRSKPLPDARAWIAELLAWKLPAPATAGNCLLCDTDEDVAGELCSRCYVRCW